MSFLSGLKKVGKGILKVGKVAAPIALAATGVGIPAAVALGAGLSAADKKASGGTWKDALISGGIGAGTSLIPGAGGAGGLVGSSVAKVGVKELAKGLAKGAVQNFATGTATGLATKQGLKNSLLGGAEAAGSGGMGAGGVGSIAKQIGKQTAMNVGGTYATKGLQKAGVPGAIAQQGGNVFSDYLGSQFNRAPAPSGSTFNPNPATGPNQIRLQGSAPMGSLVPQKPASSGINWGNTFRDLGGGILNAVANRGTGGSQPNLPGGVSIPGGGYGGYGGGTPPYRGGGGSTGPYNTGGAVGTNQGYRILDENAPAQQQQQASGDKPPTWAERYGPIIAQAGGVAVGAGVGRLAQKNAMNRSPEEQAALAGAQSSAGDLGRVGGQLAQQGQDYLQKPGQYFQTLLGGNRAAMSQAVAGPMAQLTGTYRGAERNLQQQGVRGAARDVAAADLNRDRASKIAGLTTGVQPYAAEQLANMGQNAVQTGVGAMGASGTLYGNLLGQGYANRVYARGEGEKTAKAIGGLAREVGEQVFKRPQQAGTPAPAPKTKTPTERTPAPNPRVGNGLPTNPPGPITGSGGAPPSTFPGAYGGQFPMPFGKPGDYNPYGWTS